MYNPDTANNGGGYWQFEGGCLFDLDGRIVAVEVQDYSCGDFGSRLYAQIADPEHVWCLSWGTMEDASIEAEYPDYAMMLSATGCLFENAWKLIDVAMESAVIIAWAEFNERSVNQ